MPGVPGMCTVHANSAREALTKICTLPLLAGENVTAGFVVPTVASAIDLVVHLAVDDRGRRRTLEIVAVPGRVENGVVEATDVFRARDGDDLQGATTATVVDIEVDHQIDRGGDSRHHEARRDVLAREQGKGADLGERLPGAVGVHRAHAWYAGVQRDEHVQ